MSWNIMKLEGNNDMELFEEEVEIYNSKLRLMSWLYDELRLHPDKIKDKVNDIGQKLPLNL